MSSTCIVLGNVNGVLVGFVSSKLLYQPNHICFILDIELILTYIRFSEFIFMNYKLPLILMKKIIPIILSIILLYLITDNALAGTLSAGGYASYSWWDPIYEESITLENHPLTANNDVSFELKPQFMYGPVLAYVMDDWAFGALFLAGQYFVEAEGFIGTGPVYYYRSSPDIWRYDLDLSASYDLLSFMKVFMGFKYQHYRYEVERSFSGLGVAKEETKYNNCGLAFGVAFTVNLAGNLYLMGNISALYQFSVITMDDAEYSLSNVRTSIIHRWAMGSGLGCNVTLSLAYYFDSLSTTLSLGARYQYVYLFETNNNAINMLTSKRYDQFYGVFMTAMYSLDI